MHNCCRMPFHVFAVVFPVTLIGESPALFKGHFRVPNPVGIPC